jgi:hypothetical protein
MPDTSKSQFRLMRAVEHSPSFAAKVGIPQSVGKDFSDADKAGGISYASLPARKGPQRTASAKRKARVGR